ncbi:MAG: hypothetical protein C9356_10260 [Oleiphilus sp.]|nr:MAG: hypothetical protein C9356_10260 [Oleiphilus sp.]
MLKSAKAIVHFTVLMLFLFASGSNQSDEVDKPHQAPIEIDSSSLEKVSRLAELLSKVEASIVHVEKHSLSLDVAEKRIAEDKSNWKKVKESIQFALEDENFIPGSQNFTALRAHIAERIDASNQRARSKQHFMDYYLGQEDSVAVFIESPPSLRDSDPDEVKNLIQQLIVKEKALKKQAEVIKEKRNSLLISSLVWERLYRDELFQSRGSLINEVIAGSAFAINNLAPIRLEISSLTSSVKFYFWSSVSERSASSSKKRLLTFNMIRDTFKILIFALVIVFLIRSRNQLFDSAQQWVTSKLRQYKHLKSLIAIVELARELFLFFILFLAGELVIQALVRVGLDFDALLKSALHLIIIYLLALGIINFVSPKLSQREQRKNKNNQQVLAMESVFKLVPKAYLLYWLITGISHSVLSESLSQSLIEFYLDQLIGFIALGLLLIGIRSNCEHWRLVNDKATRSTFWQNLSQKAQGRYWEPLVLLAGGGIGVYRVAWRFLIEQLTEVEMGKRFQAMLSRALLERQYRKSMRVIEQSWFPERYWRSFSFRTPAETAWYVHRDEAESVVQEGFEQWHTQHDGQRILLCGDRGIGKSEIIRHFCEKNQIEPLSVKLAVGQADNTSLYQQLSQSLLEDDIKNVDDIVDAINAFPPSVICLENLENAMLRKVGGFDGFACVIDFLLRTSQHHFWLCTCTSFAWTIAKQAVAGSSCFNDLIFVTGMSEEELRKLVLTRHFTNYEHAPDFSHLSSAATTDARRRSAKKAWTDKEQEEKNTELYFRILWDYTRGNPRQALYFWKSSLQWSDGVVAVHLFEVPEQRVLENLSDSTLMLLAALIEHNGLTQDGLADVMNTSQTNIRRRLEELAPYNMLYRYPDDDNPGWHIESFWSRAVENYLEKRQFLFRGHTL